MDLPVSNTFGYTPPTSRTARAIAWTKARVLRPVARVRHRRRNRPPEGGWAPSGTMPADQLGQADRER